MGKPIKGARIRPALVDVEDIGFEPPEFLSDANGHVTLKGVSEGEYGSYFFVEAETTAGEFAAKLIWYPGKERSRWVGKQPPGTLLVEGENFEIRLPAPDPLILEFVDKENRRPAKIESAEFWTLSAPDSLRQWSHKRIPIEGNKIKFGFLRPGLNFISIKMNPESMLPDQLIKIKRTAGAKPLGHQRIEVLRGSRVSGRVVEKGTLQPIADAAVAYIARDPAAQRRDGILTPTYVRTDQNGRFELIVPAAEAKLRVAGECGPFCVPPVEEGISSGGSAIDRSKFIEDFEIKIDPKPGETIDLTAFELERSKLIRGQVRDQDGAAAPFAEFLVDRSSYQSNGSPIYGSTDEQGRFELDNVLTNALTDLPFGNRQRRIIFWDRDRTLLGQAEFSKETENELEVVLKPAHAVLGRVVDGLTGKPIANAMLTVNGNHRLEIGAKSANDGTFLLEFISEQGGSINASYAGYQTNRATVKFAKNQVLKEIDDIAITAYDAYGSPERVPNESRIWGTTLWARPFRCWMAIYNPNSTESLRRNLVTIGILQNHNSFLKRKSQRN